MADKPLNGDSRLDVLRRQQQKAEQSTIADTLRRRQEEEDEFKRKEMIASQFGLTPQETKKFVDRPELATPFETIKQAAGVVKSPEGTEQTLAAKVANTPAQVPVGGEGTKPSNVEPTTPAAGKQEKKPADVTTSAMGSVAAALNKEQASKKPNASTQTKQTTLDELDKVAAEVNADERFKYDPVRTDLVQLRAEAYKAYKEKADRNEWMDLAEKAINAIGQFASAKAAYGTQFTGGLPLSRTDYGARTDQAFREYQAELGVIGEQAKAQERGAERLESAKDKEIARRQRTVMERLEDERLQKRLASGEKEAAIRAGAGAASDKRREERDVLQFNLSKGERELERLGKEIKSTEQALKLAGLIGTGKSSDIDKQVAEFAPYTELSAEEIEATAKEKGSVLPGKPSKDDVRRQLIAAEAEKLRQKLATNKQMYADTATNVRNLTKQYMGQPTETPTAPAAGQATPPSGKVLARIPGYDWRELTAEQFAAAKAKYPNIETK